MPGRVPLEEVPLEQPVSPERVPLKAPPAGASPLQQRGQPHLDVTPAAGLYIMEALPVIAHEIHEAESSVEYAYAATNVQNRSAREQYEIIPNTFKQAMTLPVKLEWKATSHKEVASLKKNNVYTLLPEKSVSTGHNIIGSR